MDIVETLEQDVEAIFRPKPGGMIDRARQEKAKRDAAAREAENIDESPSEPAYKAVKTAPLSPDTIKAVVVTVPEGGTAMILPNNPYRYRATIVLTSNGLVNYGQDSSIVLGGGGFPVPTGVIITIMARCQLWAFNPAGNGPATVAVLSESYSSEH
jgi:hypothetical protein